MLALVVIFLIGFLLCIVRLITHNDDNKSIFLAGSLAILCFLGCILAALYSESERIQDIPIADKQILDTFIGQKPEEMIILFGIYNNTNVEITEDREVYEYNNLPLEIITSTGTIKFSQKYSNVSFFVNKGRIESWRIITK